MSEWEPVPVLIRSGKRCGLRWAPAMGDWFESWSPRNENSSAEGPWDHWVDLAIRILQDPMTAIVRPEAAAAVAALEMHEFHDEPYRALTRAELNERFKRGPEEATEA